MEGVCKHTRPVFNSVCAFVVVSGNMQKIALHHTLFDWAPTGVVAIATAPKGGKLISAVRESGAIEIFEVNPSELGLSMIKVTS